MFLLQVELAHEEISQDEDGDLEILLLQELIRISNDLQYN
jgi:hypothetical protein